MTTGSRPSGRRRATTIGQAHALGLRVVPVHDRRPRRHRRRRPGRGGRADHQRPAARAQGRGRAGCRARGDPAAAQRAAACAARPRDPDARHDRGLRIAAPRSPRVRDAAQAGARHVETYASFRTKIECMIRERVLPRLARGAPNVVAFNEDIGLMTLGTGSRAPRHGPSPRTRLSVCPGRASPSARRCRCSSRIKHQYSGPIGAYKSRFPELPFFSSVFTGGTDTFARGWMQVFSDMASATACTSSARTTSRRSASRSTRPRSSCSATPTCRCPARCTWPPGPKAYNEVFMWGPRRRARRGPGDRCGTWSRRTRRCRSPTSSRRSRSPTGPAPDRTRSRTCGRTRCRARRRGSDSPPACRRSSTATRPRASIPARTPASTTCAAWTSSARTW